MKENILYRVMAEFYDYVPLYRQRDDVAFYVELVTKNGGPALELGCGTGRITIPIARAGVNIIGLDYSPAMLAVAARKTAEENRQTQQRLHWIHGDMRHFQFDHRFRSIIIPFHAFQHLLYVKDQLDCLQCIHHHLVEGGLLVVDAFHPNLSYFTEDTFLQEWGEEPEFIMPDGRRVYRRFRTIKRDCQRQLLSLEMIYYVTYPDGREERYVEHLSMRYFFRYELEHLIARSGFSIIAVYVDYRYHLFEEAHASEIIVVAKKN